MPPSDANDLAALALARRSLAPGMTLGRLGRALVTDEASLLEEIRSKIQGFVELPADVYRFVTRAPDERAIRENLPNDALSIVVPVARRLADAGELIPNGRWMQPVLLGKIFGIHDYIEDRKAAIAALPGLPEEIYAHAVSAARFLIDNRAKVNAAIDAMPPAGHLARLADLPLWRDLVGQEWRATCERIDAHYAGVIEDPKRVERDLPVFRVAYAVAYHTLAHLDPVAGYLARLTPGGIAAYQRFATHRERMARVVGALQAAQLDPGVPTSVQEAPPEPATTPADIASQTFEAPGGESTSVGALRPASPDLGLPATETLASPLHPPSAGSLPTRPGLPMPAADPLGPAAALELTDPGIGPAPRLSPLPLPAGARSAPLPATDGLPSGPLPPAGAARSSPLPATDGLPSGPVLPAGAGMTQAPMALAPTPRSEIRSPPPPRSPAPPWQS